MSRDPPEYDLTPLVRLMQQGDEDAFEQLHLHTQKDVLRCAMSLHVSEADAHDVAQETWFQIWKKRRSLRDPDAFLPWLLSTTANKTRNWIKRHQRELARRDPAAAVETLFAKADRPAQAAKLDELLRGIPEPSRTIMQLKYGDGLTRAQIARSNGWTEEQVDYQLDRGRALLEAKYELSDKR